MNQTIVMITGLALAGWGHLLLHDLFGAAAAWSRVDQNFPPAVQSSPSFAGVTLLLIGAVLVALPALA